MYRLIARSWFFVLAAISIYGADAPKPNVSPAAIWQTSEATIRKAHDACAGKQYPALGACFADQMKKAGASAEALRFFRLMDNEAFATHFIRAGGPDIAFIRYPFRVNTNEGCLLVNADGHWIDLETLPDQAQAELKKNPVFSAIAAAHPNLMTWAADRGDRSSVKSIKSVGEGRQFLAEYSLRECHACGDLAIVWFRYDFGVSGKFLGAHVRTIRKTPPDSDEGINQPLPANH